uniref:BPTI/Kunitz inhibitor domain-containing protein n=1 Tax=Syphacia muris TaxID=451379 RepID=A0A0N5AUN7_9BILA
MGQWTFLTFPSGKLENGLLPEEIELKGKRIPSCRDGSKPLLGAVEGIVSCKTGCPQGFSCEYPEIRGIAQNGICCADLDKLAELYGPETNTDIRKKQIIKSSMHISDTDKPIVTVSGTNDNVTGIDDAKNSRTEYFETNYKTNGTESDVLTTKSGYKYSCKRQKFESACKNRGRIPQSVIRWYLDDEYQCSSYVYNYCEPFVLNDRTLRTEDECKRLCLTKNV